MKIAILICLSLIGFALSANERGCQYINGRCAYECPEGTHSYGASCSRPAISERTCLHPVARELPPICDLSRCECDEPTVKDRNTGKCVKLEDCSKQTDLDEIPY